MQEIWRPYTVAFVEGIQQTRLFEEDYEESLKDQQNIGLKDVDLACDPTTDI